MAYKQAFTKRVYDKLREQLWKALRQNKDCDVTIKVDADVFHCHKVILAMTSPYFDAKFASGFKGTDEKVIEVQGMSPDTFRNVLEHIYRSNAALKASNVLDVLHASSMFQIESLTKRCERFLIDMYRMSQSWVKQWRAARKYNLEILLEMTNSFMFTNFRTISETALFTNLTAVELCEIVASDELRVTHEADVLKAVLLWTKSQESYSDTDLTQLLSRVSINQISDATFKSTIFPLLQTLGEKALDIVEDVKKEQHVLRKLVVRHNDKPRNILFGYLEIHGKKALKMYSLEDHKTYDVPALPGIHNVAGIPRGFAFKGDLMFTSLSSVYRLNEQTWLWDNMSLPPIHVIQILNVQHKLYVFGVSDDGVQLLRYKGDEEVAWELVGAIEGEMANCSAAAVGDTIYLVGEDLTAHSPSQVMEKVFILNAYGADAVSCLGRFQPPLSQGKFSVSIASKDDKMYYLTTESEFGMINDANSPQGITRFHQLDGASGCSLSGKGNELMILKTVESKTHIYTVDLEEMTLHLLEDVPALKDGRLGVIKTSIIDKCSEVEKKVQRSKETSRHPYSDLELDKRSHSDLTVIVGDASFPCHKIIVKFMSPYMEKHLSAGDGEMTLENVDDNAFRDILNFMYTGVLPPLCEDNIAAALQAATVLQMDDLQTDIEKKIKVINKDKSPNIKTFKDYL